MTVVYTYSDKYAVEVLWFVGVAVRGKRFTEDLCQALHARDAQDVDVDVTAERLDEREVNLQRNISLVFLVGRQNAQYHIVWVSVVNKITYC